MIVVDTNVLSYVVIEGEHTDLARAVYRRDPLWIAPALWSSEFLNVLAISVRADVLTEPQAQTAWQNASALLDAFDVEPDPNAVLSLAIKANIAAYDAQFVALAEALKTVLVTADRQLTQRCPEVTVLMSDFANHA